MTKAWDIVGYTYQGISQTKGGTMKDLRVTAYIKTVPSRSLRQEKTETWDLSDGARLTLKSIRDGGTRRVATLTTSDGVVRSIPIAHLRRLVKEYSRA